MTLKLCILASGSSGNCIYVGTDRTSILVDAGLSGRETERRATQIGLQLDRLAGICLSHEHTDHAQGVGVLHRRFNIPLYANSGTIEGVCRGDRTLKDAAWRRFETSQAFDIGDLRIEPYMISHDTLEPVGFIVSSGGVRIGIATDMGLTSHLVRERLRDCRALVLEFNHDEKLLEKSHRPPEVKRRIRSRQGHLSNTKAAALLAEIGGVRLERVYLAHLSEECNRPELALRAAEAALRGAGHGHVSLVVCGADAVSEAWSCQIG